MKNLTQFILILREHYVQSKYVENYQQINRGWCVAFAEEVEAFLGDCEVISNDFLVLNIDEGWNGDENDNWSLRELIKYNSPPPISTEELKNRIKGYHRWIYYKEKHFDAECPFGVENLFDLPFFKRHLEAENLQMLNSINLI